MSYKRRFLAITFMSTFVMLSASAAFAAPEPGATEIYKAKCTSCHGADGGGQTAVGKAMKIRDLRSPEVQKQTDADLLKLITDGKAKMPAYKEKLSIADISSLVAYIRGMAKK